jgi:hypothetical protein
MILVQNRRKGQNYIRKDKINSGLGTKEFRIVYNILVQSAGADSKVIGVKFVTVFIMQMDAACS